MSDDLALEAAELMKQMSAEISRLNGKVERLTAALREIADSAPEDDEWDGVDKYHICRERARAALAGTEGKP